MICQVTSIQDKTQSLAQFSKGLLQVRHIQARLRENVRPMKSSNEESFANPMTSGPFLVPTHLWFD
jgi:hypothetical protein